MKKIILLTILVLGINGCFLSHQTKPIEYYILNSVPQPCLKKVKITGPSFYLSDKIVIRRNEFAIGTLNNVYWISSLKSLLGESLVSNKGNKTANIKIKKFNYLPKEQEVRLELVANICKKNNCQNKALLIKESLHSKAPDEIVATYQKTINTLSSRLCSN